MKEWKVGDHAIEINYQGEVELVEEIGPGLWWAKAVGWELPPWDDPTPCSEDDLIPMEEDSDAG